MPADAPVPSRIRRGDGLVGQVIADKRSFAVDSVPENYLYFGSGLGKGKPDWLLLTPTFEDDEVTASSSSASPASRAPRRWNSLSAPRARSASPLRSAQYRTRLEELLEETAGRPRNCAPMARS